MNSKDLTTEEGEYLPEPTAEVVPQEFSERESIRREALAASKAEDKESDRQFLETLLDDPVDGYEAWIKFLTKDALSLETLKKEDAPLPTRDEALAFLLEKLTPAQMEILRSTDYVSKPKFLLVPMVSVERLLPKISETRTRDVRQLGGHAFLVDKWSAERMQRVEYNEDSSGESIVGWQLGIVEAAEVPKILPNEPAHHDLGGRVFWFKNHLEGFGIRRIGHKPYALLAIEAAERGRPIDNSYNEEGGTSTLLDDASLDMNLGVAVWKPNAVCFERHYERTTNEAARQRIAVMAEMINY